MTTLAHDLAQIAAGWSCRQAIVARADAVRHAAKNGDHDRAEALTAEIEALQAAHHAYHGRTMTMDPAPAGYERWILAPRAWAERLIHADLMERDFIAPAGSDAETAAGYARGWFVCRILADVITAADVRLVREADAVRRAA